MNLGIHPSHKMTEFRDTIVTITCTPRFGSIRECEYCGAEHAKTVAGQAMHDELHTQCLCAPKATENTDASTS